MRVTPFLTTIGIISVALFGSARFANGQQTPPIQPKIQSAPLPPIIAVTPPPGAETKPKPLTMSEAIRIGLQRQTSIAIAKGNVEAAARRVQQAKAGTFPNLTLSGSYNNVQTFTQAGGTNNNTNPGFSANLAVSQLIYDFNVTRDQVRQNEALLRALSHATTKAEADTILAVRQAYLNLIQTQQLVTVAEANVTNRQSQFALAKARVDRGLGAPPDVVRAQSNTDDAILQLTVARSNVSLAQVNLAVAMGIDPRTPFEVSIPSAPSTFNDDLTALVQTGLDNRPELLSAKETLVASTLGETIARRSTLPTVSVTYTLNGRGDSDITSTQRGTLGIVVSWGIFDGGLAAGRVRETKANEEVAKQQITSASQTVIAEVTSAYVGFRTAQQRVDLSQSQILNAEEGVRLAEGRYRNGLGTFLEITDAQAALVQARINQISAQILVRQQFAALMRAVGKPMQE